MAAAGATNRVGGVDAAVRGAVPGVVELRLVDTTDEDHVVGAADGRRSRRTGGSSKSTSNCSLQRHRRVMGALALIDSGVLHSVQIKCAAAP